MILFLTKDLMIQSAVSSVARERGIKFKATTKPPRLADLATGADVFLIDLQLPGMKISELLQVLSGIENRPSTIAFAQHVNVDLLESAESEFIDQVMTRGQFNKSIPNIVAAVEQPEESTEK